MNTVNPENIDWSTLLGRSPEPLDPSAWPHLSGRRVLVTGAGGSIGSALAKAVLACGAGQVVLLECGEQALYRIEGDLADLGLASCAISILGSVTDEWLLQDVFDRFCPSIVFHAAAFKHVSLMEAHPLSALENNTVGTYLVARAAARFGAERFITVSTDKAVGPAGIMGASKHLAELVVGSFARSRTKMNVVRLGNVLGSEGSVAPRFVRQILHGGPVTITHAETTRYFFTLDETVVLILAASGLDDPGVIVIPRETEPLNVGILAKFLIDQLGAKSRDIAIQYTGLRPGEKMTEDMCSAQEQQNVVERDGYRLVWNPGLSVDDTERMIEGLRAALRQRDPDQLLQLVQRFVPEYHPSETVQSLCLNPRPR